MVAVKNSMIEICTDKKQWDAIIKTCPHADFYHTYDYHQLCKQVDEQAILLKYTGEEHCIVLPLLIRFIEGTPYKDATSVYGYAGPLCTSGCNDFANDDFVDDFQELFLKNNIVSVFSRLNPYIPNQELILKDFGTIVNTGKVINIDLTQNQETQERAYQSRLRTYVNKARRLCTIKEALNKDDIDIFIDMYYENMRRVNAKAHYFFDRQYFFDLMKSNSFEAQILLAVYNETEEIIGGSLFIKKGDIVQYHLSGSREEYLYLNPIKLLIDEMRQIATKENYTYFNLGGGVGSKEDSLFQFKSCFSKNYKDFKVWKYIVNQEVYNELIAKKQKREHANLNDACLNFFPSYRCEL